MIFKILFINCIVLTLSLNNSWFFILFISYIVLTTSTSNCPLLGHRDRIFIFWLFILWLCQTHLLFLGVSCTLIYRQKKCHLWIKILSIFPFQLYKNIIFLALSHWLGPLVKWRCLCAKSLQSCLTLCNPMDCSPPGFSVHGILQARIVEWVAMPSSGGVPDSGMEPTSRPSAALAGGLFTASATWWQWMFLPHSHSSFTIKGNVIGFF